MFKAITILMFIPNIAISAFDCESPLDDHGWSCNDLTQTLDSCYDIEHFAGYDCYGCNCESISSSSSSSSTSSSTTNNLRILDLVTKQDLERIVFKP